ncbi:hypothetical protein C5L38_33750 (plasmid) [Streptomyces sp. WAC00288]|uniref:hypothetical protein n=1 Tax=unclassified Streptomyces TaxID=2593676 RepID=UPI000789503B|nr:MULTISPECIES: hypothetical protein [unclassified Streptomyces]AVI00047.1 hypothetical protein C5L38_33750 [Streptomyces sp. WAC00288]KYG51111.1 hypothetical protein AWI43_32175 [Streptomyces sp. WAC04657]
MSNGLPFGQGSILGKELGGQAPVSPGTKEKIPAYVTPDTMNRLRNTVVALQRIDDEDADVPVSLSAYVEAAVLERIRRDEREYNGGKPFPQRRQKNLKTGPPVTK